MLAIETYKLHFPCKEHEFACTPDQYIKAIEDHITFDAK